MQGRSREYAPFGASRQRQSLGDSRRVRRSRPCPFMYPREPLTMSGAEGPSHAASIPFRLSYEPEAAHALAGEAWKALPQSLATGCAEAELLWASRGARMLKRPSRVPCGRNIPWPFSLSRARRLSLPWRREKAVSGAPQKRARRLRRVIPNILNRTIPRISRLYKVGCPQGDSTERGYSPSRILPSVLDSACGLATRVNKKLEGLMGLMRTTGQRRDIERSLRHEDRCRRALGTRSKSSWPLGLLVEMK